MRLIFAIFAFALLALSSNSAHAAPKFWIERDGGLFSDEYITDGKNQYKSGMFGAFNWSEEQINDASLKSAFETRNRDLKLGKIIYWSGFAAIIASVFVPYDYFWPVLGTGFVASLWGAHYGLKARQHDLDMLNQINGVTKRSEQQITFDGLRFKSDRTPLLTMAWTF